MRSRPSWPDGRRRYPAGSLPLHVERWSLAQIRQRQEYTASQKSATDCPRRHTNAALTRLDRPSTQSCTASPFFSSLDSPTSTFRFFFLRSADMPSRPILFEIISGTGSVELELVDAEAVSWRLAACVVPGPKVIDEEEPGTGSGSPGRSRRAVDMTEDCCDQVILAWPSTASRRCRRSDCSTADDRPAFKVLVGWEFARANFSRALRSR